MEYHGKLYGNIAGKYFDTGKTTADYDKLEAAVTHLTKIQRWIPIAEEKPTIRSPENNYLSVPVLCRFENGKFEVLQYDFELGRFTDGHVTFTKSSFIEWKYIQ
jgi:hypothetical protein